MPAKKPTLQEVMEAIQSLNVGMGAELVALRAEVEKQNQKIGHLSDLLSAKAWNPQQAMNLPVDLVSPYHAEDVKVTVGANWTGGNYSTPDLFAATAPFTVGEKAAIALGDKTKVIDSYRQRVLSATGVLPSLNATKSKVMAYFYDSQAAGGSLDVEPTYVVDGWQYSEGEILNAVVPLSDEEKALVAAGKKIDAIKEYRNRVSKCSGVVPNLLESKNRVMAYFEEVQSEKPKFDPLSPPPLLPEHMALVKQGLKIDAIKAYRTYTMKVCGLVSYAGLKESKDIIDAYAWSIGASNFAPAVTFVKQPW